MTIRRAVGLALLLATPARAQGLAPAPQVHQLRATPQTVAWGHYSAATPPVLRIRPGDAVAVHTLLTSSPARLEGAGVAPGDVEQDLRDIHDRVKDKGPGGHILTGPIFVEGAEPGDALEVRIEAITLPLAYSYNAFGPRSGAIPEDFPRSKLRIIPLDRERMVAPFAPGVAVPLRPFFGSMGVAPPAAMGRVNSAPPGIHAGNLDNKDLVAGTTLLIPVHVPGALFQVGDGHAAQGDGEVDITALETSLDGTLRFSLRKGAKLAWPRAETPTHHVAMGIDRDLDEAMKVAVREAVALIVEQYHLDRDDAYMLCSIAVDFRVTQVVDGTKGVHAMIPKAIFKK